MAAPAPRTLLLGTAQDGGYPHVGCAAECCARAWIDSGLRRLRASLAIVDPLSKERWIIDSTPDFPEQLRRLDECFPVEQRPGLAGILLTHAHIGHYTGLVSLGREGMNARAVPVYAMPQMTEFLLKNQPWKQLVTLVNIELRPLHAGRALKLSDQISVTPLSVPHRSEISETVGFRIEFPKRSLLYVPDIDGWDDRNLDLAQSIFDVDTAYLDGTFFSDDELPGRDLAEIPHPRIAEFLLRFGDLPERERAKIRFVHLNHTNPVLHPASDAAKQVAQAGMHVAHDGEQIAGS